MSEQLKFMPFYDRFVEPIRSGEKIVTARTRRWGNAGDLLQTPAGVIRLLAVYKRMLGEVRDQWYLREGCASPEDFEAVWKTIHPRRGFRYNDLVYLHEFEYDLEEN